jgi:hypothetical protein
MVWSVSFADQLTGRQTVQALMLVSLVAVRLAQPVRAKRHSVTSVDRIFQSPHSILIGGTLDLLRARAGAGVIDRADSDKQQSPGGKAAPDGG